MTIKKIRKEKSKKKLSEMCAQDRREGLETEAERRIEREKERERELAVRGRRDEKDKVVEKTEKGRTNRWEKDKRDSRQETRRETRKMTRDEKRRKKIRRICTCLCATRLFILKIDRPRLFVTCSQIRNSYRICGGLYRSQRHASDFFNCL